MVKKASIPLTANHQKKRVLPEAINIRRDLHTQNEHVSAPYNELSSLIRDCLAQSPRAQKRMYDLYAPAAFGTIKRYLYNNEIAAEEILNDAFLKVLTKLDQFNYNGSFEGWIRRIVVNCITDYARKNLIKEQKHSEVQNEDVYINSDSVEKISHKELLQLIQTLPGTQRTVFNLFVFENYSHKDIATTLGISENNSRWYLNDARKRLKEKINFIMK